jgi:hypothetical protein
MMMMQTQDMMTFSKAISILDEFVDRMGWLATPAHGTLPDKAAEAVSFLKKRLEITPLAGAMWTDEPLNQRVYSLTRLALEDPQQADRVLQEFEDIVSTGYGLPIQKAYLLWESKVISIEKLIIFLQDCYKHIIRLQDPICLDELMRWLFHLVWTVTRPSYHR